MRHYGMMRAAVFAVVVVSAFAQEATAPPAFEAASIKPNRSGGGNSSSHSRTGLLQMTNVSLWSIIVRAYRIKDYQLSGPDWLRTERFDIMAKPPSASTEEQLMPMLQTMLAERFKLQTHHETKDFPVYALVEAKGGIRFKPVDPTGGSSTNSSNDEKGGELKVERTTMSRLAEWISSRVDRPVLDMTGLTGAYTFGLKFSIESERSDSDTAKYPIVPLAIQEQLGLRLEKRTAPLEILVVDRAEKAPTEN
jgi:uncharacterized protein (TIGR03435 family)